MSEGSCFLLSGLLGVVLSVMVGCKCMLVNVFDSLRGRFVYCLVKVSMFLFVSSESSIVPGGGLTLSQLTTPIGVRIFRAPCANAALGVRPESLLLC